MFDFFNLNPVCSILEYNWKFNNVGNIKNKVLITRIFDNVGRILYDIIVFDKIYLFHFISFIILVEFYIIYLTKYIS